MLKNIHFLTSPFIINSENETKQKLLNSKIPFISSIVTVYNIDSKYLITCLESLIHQSISNIEIIIVNDCSPLEENHAICINYAEKDSRIKYIKNSENFGVAKSKHIGLSLATGYAVHFMDGDDFFALHGYDMLFNYMVSTNIDIIHFNFITYNENESKLSCDYQYFSTIQPEVLFGSDIFMSFIHNISSPHLANKLYKRDFVTQVVNDPKYTYSNVTNAEDLELNLKLFYNANSLVFYNAPLYYYRNRDDSASRSISKRHVQSFQQVFENLFEYFSQHDSFCLYIELLHCMINYFSYLFNITVNKKSTTETIREFDESLRKTIKIFEKEISLKTIKITFMNSKNKKFSKWYSKNM